MSHLAIQVQNLSKVYQLGQIGTGTISRDFERFFATKILGKEDPFHKIGQANDRTTKGSSDIVWSLKDISFDIQQGDAVGIIGRNGAGKSTLLKILSRVTSPSKGVIKIKGRIASLLEVGTGFHPELSGRENIYLNGAILGMRKKEIKRKFDEIVDFSGVERYIDTPVKRYSSGMYVRLAFAVAAHLESEILIVDEVLSVGDAEFQKKCLGKMNDVSRGEGRTVLFVSHNIGAVRTLCQQGMYLKNGQLEYAGLIEDTVTKYLIDTSGRGGIPIRNRADRIGNGQIRMDEIIFINRQELATEEILCGDYLRIEFQFQKLDGIPIHDMIVACSFSDQYENKIVSWVSDEMPHQFVEKEHNHFTLEIPNFNLRPGSYNFSYQISRKTTAPEDFCDVLNNVASIQVLASDFFYSGKNVRSANSVLLYAAFQ
jgi:lipopolysaccharide transport system ATP-binding protein